MIRISKHTLTIHGLNSNFKEEFEGA